SKRDPQPEIKQGLEMIEKGLAINPDFAELYALKGRLLLIQARATNNQSTTHQSVEALEKALRINQWLQFEYQPTLLEARQLFH
ncbi:MAG TPA: hypothetical protein PLU80_22695, partial [Acidobacteriota bacterium]|nr:hypothetical protein [Acidobacteriota bacterium]